MFHKQQEVQQNYSNNFNIIQKKLSQIEMFLLIIRNGIIEVFAN